ncbi:hypothetical protein FRB90_005833 [Tulasnella sp. 427]|nr:hypothetical protein FRB90_005833 [Tulasnella sp. 427]
MQAAHHPHHLHHQSVLFIQQPPTPPFIGSQLTQPIIDSTWQSSHQPPPVIHPVLATPPVVIAGGKRKLSDDFSSSASSQQLSGLDALRGKRQRRFRSASSLSDSDDDKDAFDSPRTPALQDDAMEWSAESTSSSSTALTAAGLGPNQSIPPWRAPSPSQAIHRLELLREARPPVVTTFTSSFAQSAVSRELPPAKAVPMALTTRDDEYVLSVELPGYNIDGITVSCKRGNVVTVVADIWHLPRESCHQWDIAFDGDVNTSQLRAKMDRASNVLTLIAKRYRRFVPIEYQVDKKLLHQSTAFHS